MKLWTIYCHTHIVTGRRYIGLTSRTMERRWTDHVSAAKRVAKGGRWHFPNAIVKYGPEAFSHEVLEVHEDLTLANEAEERLIRQYDTRNPEKGFNLAPGGAHVPHPFKNPWERLGFREKQRKNLPRLHSPEVRAANKASLNTERSKAKRSTASKAVMSDPAVLAKVRRPEVLSNHQAYFEAWTPEKSAVVSQNARSKSPEVRRRGDDKRRVLDADGIRELRRRYLTEDKTIRDLAAELGIGREAARCYLASSPPHWNMEPPSQAVLDKLASRQICVR